MANNFGNLRDKLPEIIKQHFDPDNGAGITYLHTHFANLIEVLESAPNVKKQKESLVRSLGQIDKSLISDTEDREAVLEIFSEIASAVGVNISKELNFWMYGKVLGTIANLKGIINLKSSGPVLKELCRNCKTELELVVNSQSNSVPDHWEIVTCNSCKSRNLFNMDCQASEVSYVNCLHSQTLMQSDYTREQVERLL